MRHFGSILAVCLLAIVSVAQTDKPQLGSLFSSHHTQVKLILSADTVKPGDTLWAGVDMKMEPGWHTYWKNSGAAGLPTKIDWQLPSGVTAGDIQWPLPEKLPPAEVTTYGYNDEVMLLIPLTIASNAAIGSLDLKAKVSWLECKEACLPGRQDIAAKLNIDSGRTASPDAAMIELWKKKVPPLFDLSLAAWWQTSTNDATRSLVISFPTKRISVEIVSADFFPFAGDQFEVQAATESSSTPAKIYLRKPVKKFSGDWPKELAGVFLYDAPHYGTNAFEVKFSVADQPPAGETAFESATPSAPENAGQRSAPLWQMLLYAFLGGLILNIMPCVLPVIALKILGFVSEARSEPRRVRNLGLIYAAGVLVSFLALAAIVIAVKTAGHRAGWGMQFGNPIFLVCLTTLVTLVALNLFGVFEVTLSGRAQDAAGKLASKHGATGAFFNGFLATALATPCTAPFLAPALGFAFAQSAMLIVAVFVAAGLGLAAPYLLLSFNPSWLKFLPKPGAWMEKFKVAMGFPMLATAVWLFNVAGSTYGKDIFWLGIFLVTVALAAWIFGTFVQHGRKHRPAAAIIALLLFTGSYAFALEKELHWRTPAPITGTARSATEAGDEIPWQPWSPDAVAKARAEGRPVLVDFTADWCLTCQVNKKVAIDVDSVRAKLKAINAVALAADYTRTPDNIAEELEKYHRAGVPLVLVFPKTPDQPAIVLPQVLTPGIVLDALERAAH